MSAWSVSRWRRRYGGTRPATAASAASAGAAASAIPTASREELERQVRALQRELADTRQQQRGAKKSLGHLLPRPAMRMAAAERLAGEFSLALRCRALGVSRSGLYGARRKAQRPRARINAALAERAATLFEQSHRTYGARRLAAALRRGGESCGRHRWRA